MTVQDACDWLRLGSRSEEFQWSRLTHTKMDFKAYTQALNVVFIAYEYALMRITTHDLTITNNKQYSMTQIINN